MALNLRKYENIKHLRNYSGLREKRRESGFNSLQEMWSENILPKGQWFQNLKNIYQSHILRIHSKVVE